MAQYVVHCPYNIPARFQISQSVRNTCIAVVMLKKHADLQRHFSQLLVLYRGCV